MTLREIYKKVKDGYSLVDDKNWQYINVGYSTRYVDYGKEYIYYQHYGSSATTVSYESFLFIVHDIFDCKNAKELLLKLHFDDDK